LKKKQQENNNVELIGGRANGPTKNTKRFCQAFLKITTFCGHDTRPTLILYRY